MGLCDEIFGCGDASDSVVLHFHDFAGDFVGGERVLRIHRRNGFLFPRIGGILGVEVCDFHRPGWDGEFAKCVDFRHAFGCDDDDCCSLHLQLAKLALPVKKDSFLCQLRRSIYLVRRYSINRPSHITFK